jgi:hypothetical protein
MYSQLTKFIVLLALMVCLPLQGLAAVTMPSCQAHDTKMEMHVATGHADSMERCEHHAADHVTKKSPCDKCLSCYLSAAQAIIPFNIAFDLSTANPMIDTLTLVTLNAVPSSHFHPPRTTLA